MSREEQDEEGYILRKRTFPPVVTPSKDEPETVVDTILPREHQPNRLPKTKGFQTCVRGHKVCQILAQEQIVPNSEAERDFDGNKILWK